MGLLPDGITFNRENTMNSFDMFTDLPFADGGIERRAANDMFAQNQQMAGPHLAPQLNFPSASFTDEAIDPGTLDMLSTPYSRAPEISSFGHMDSDFFGGASASTYTPQQNLDMNRFIGNNSWDSPLSHPFSNDDLISTQPISSIQNFHKRPLECMTQDLPQPKRQVLSDYQTLSPFTTASTVPSTTTADSIWTPETVLSQTEMGLTDDAADMCATWFSKYNVFPSEQHIAALSLLTRESPSAIQQWFGQILKQGMAGSHDSAYKSQSTLGQEAQSNGNTSDSQTSQEASGACNHETRQTSTQPQTTRKGKKGCTPTENLDLLCRDDSKIYQCTRKCGKRYGRKCDWKRNEEEGYASKSWLCSLCRDQGVGRVKPCYRRYHFKQHFTNIHPELNYADYEIDSIVHSETEFPRRCGFCPMVFSSRQERIDHIAEHFQKGSYMLQWKDYEDEGGDQDDGADDDDRPDSAIALAMVVLRTGIPVRIPQYQSGSKRQGGGSSGGSKDGSGSYYGAGQQYTLSEGGASPPQGSQNLNGKNHASLEVRKNHLSQETVTKALDERTVIDLKLIDQIFSDLPSSKAEISPQPFQSQIHDEMIAYQGVQEQETAALSQLDRDIISGCNSSKKGTQSQLYQTSTISPDIIDPPSPPADRSKAIGDQPSDESSELFQKELTEKFADTWTWVGAPKRDSDATDTAWGSDEMSPFAPRARSPQNWRLEFLQKTSFLVGAVTDTGCNNNRISPTLAESLGYDASTAGGRFIPRIPKSKTKLEGHEDTEWSKTSSDDAERPKSRGSESGTGNEKDICSFCYEPKSAERTFKTKADWKRHVISGTEPWSAPYYSTTQQSGYRSSQPSFYPPETYGGSKLMSQQGLSPRAKFISSTPGVHEHLQKDYFAKKPTSTFFQQGAVFKVLFPGLAGEQIPQNNSSAAETDLKYLNPNSTDIPKRTTPHSSSKFIGGSEEGSQYSPTQYPRLRVKKQSPQKSIDDFWDKFTTKRLSTKRLRFTSPEKGSLCLTSPGNLQELDCMYCKCGYAKVKSSKEDVCSHCSDLGVGSKYNDREEPKTLEESKSSPIAVVGMSTRLPGGDSSDEFWRLLQTGTTTAQKVPAPRFSVDGFYDPSRSGSFIDNPEGFDSSFFKISSSEPLQMDPQQRLLLETAYEALEMAGFGSDSAHPTPFVPPDLISQFLGTSQEIFHKDVFVQDSLYWVSGRPGAGKPHLMRHLQDCGQQLSDFSPWVSDISSSSDIRPLKEFLSLKLLGAGGFSTVDEVIHRGTNLHISRKTLKSRSQSNMAELQKEVSVLRKLRHPHIIRFLGAYTRSDKVSILLSPVADTTLAAWLEQCSVENPPGIEDKIVKMYGCLASSVRYLHQQRPVIKHMDIKPQNILVTHTDSNFPQVILCDFGISEFSEDSTEDGHSAPLTRQYCAPEAANSQTRGAKADIWSLGCVFLEMATVVLIHQNNEYRTFSKEFCGCDRRAYWQDISRLHAWLSMFQEKTDSLEEKRVLRTIQTMLSPDPKDRPEAATLTILFTPAPCCLQFSSQETTFPAPEEERSMVEMLVSQETLDCGSQLHANDFESESSKSTAWKEGCNQSHVYHSPKAWLNECLTEHAFCRANSSSSRTLPTRLLEVLNPEVPEPSLRVVITNTLPSVEYAALSLSWSLNRPQCVLTTDNLVILQEELPPGGMPQEIKDAVAACLQLGIRYLWVDSLCIVQDSLSDREAECLAMASTYRNALLTIVLDGLDEVAPIASYTNYYNADVDVDIGGHIKLPLNFHKQNLWNTRLWTLQERLLSKRLLHVTPHQLYWDCHGLKASDTFPKGLPPLVWEKVHSRPLEASWGRDRGCGPLAEKEGREGGKGVDEAPFWAPSRVKGGMREVEMREPE